MGGGTGARFGDGSETTGEPGRRSTPGGTTRVARNYRSEDRVVDEGPRVGAHNKDSCLDVGPLEY